MLQYYNNRIAFWINRLFNVKFIILHHLYLASPSNWANILIIRMSVVTTLIFAMKTDCLLWSYFKILYFKGINCFSIIRIKNILYVDKVENRIIPCDMRKNSYSYSHKNIYFKENDNHLNITWLNTVFYFDRAENRTFPN